ncbi:hypothetical protein JXD38_12645 [candidate division WOR-3 bacterium]|nr:hypothetical protein [candidate division WOR-3 bacterium]
MKPRRHGRWRGWIVQLVILIALILAGIILWRRAWYPRPAPPEVFFSDSLPL